MTPVAVAIGSNVGDRAAHIRFALQRLRSVLQGLRASSIHETAPVGVPTQGPFLNAVATGSSRLSARDLLNRLLAIEGERGRVRPYAGAPRTLDLDLVLFGDTVIDEPGLRVPHPRFRDRAFVLTPLAEIAAEWRDPETGLTVAALLAGVTDGHVT